MDLKVFKTRDFKNSDVSNHEFKEIAEVYATEVEILMVEDGLDLEQAQEVISNEYEIPIKRLRKLLSSYRETYQFAFNNLIWNEDDKTYITRFSLKKEFENIVRKLAPKMAKISEGNDLSLDTMRQIIYNSINRVV